MRPHALLLIAHSTLKPRCGAIAMVLFYIPPLIVGTRALTGLTHNTPRYDIYPNNLCCAIG
jgi:hypothetical protein